MNKFSVLAGKVIINIYKFLKVLLMRPREQNLVKAL